MGKNYYLKISTQNLGTINKIQLSFHKKETCFRVCYNSSRQLDLAKDKIFWVYYNCLKLIKI